MRLIQRVLTSAIKTDACPLIICIYLIVYKCFHRMVSRCLCIIMPTPMAGDNIGLTATDGCIVEVVFICIDCCVSVCDRCSETISTKPLRCFRCSDKDYE